MVFKLIRYFHQTIHMQEGMLFNQEGYYSIKKDIIQSNIKAIRRRGRERDKTCLGFPRLGEVGSKKEFHSIKKDIIQSNIKQRRWVRV